jgi:hypothetical protein
MLINFSLGTIYDTLAYVIYLWPFGIYIVVVWYSFSVLVCLDQEKSGNPDFPAVMIETFPMIRVESF